MYVNPDYSESEAPKRSKGPASAIEDPKAKAILSRLDQRKSKRSNFDSQFQDIKDLVRPNTLDFNTKRAPGQQNNIQIFDTTAGKCNNELASGLHSFATSPSQRWFSVTTGNKYRLNRSMKSRAWLEFVSDTIYRHYSKPSAGHKTSLHEIYLDLGAFGNAVLFQDIDWKNKSLVFRAFPLACCWWSENNNGIVDSLDREVILTTTQAIQEFGEEALPKEILDTLEKQPDKEWTFVHSVYPREKRDVKRLDGKNKKFASCWVSKELKVTVRESGYTSFPYHCSRWTKIAGEVYGRSPAMDCLPTIKLVNEQEKTVMKVSQKRADPPMVLDNDGFLLPVNTNPGGMIYRDSSEGKIELLETGDAGVAHESLREKREQIAQHFYVDWLRMQKDDVQMTATEVLDRRDEKLRLMSPMLGRLESELLSPMIQRSYELLTLLGEIPPCPDELRSERLIIDYVSPAALAQSGTKATTIIQTLREFAEIAPVAPTIFDRFNFDRIADTMTKLRGVTTDVLNTDEELAAMRKKRDDQQQLAAGADVGGKVAGAVKDLSQARMFANKAA
jgi:hypothetical protein